MRDFNIRNRLRSWMHTNREIVRFLLFFSVLLVVFFVVFSLISSSFDFLRVGTAHLTSAVADLLGMETKVHGSTLSMATMDFEVIAECTGVFAMMIYAAAVVAYPARWKERVLGLVVGIPIIFGVNVARMVALVYVALYHENSFEYVHSYLWQGTFVIFVILVWFLWIRRVVHS